MTADSDEYDFFVSYARADNRDGWISQFVEELLAEHRKFSGGEKLECFFDKDDIKSFDDWPRRLREALSKSRLFLAFLSPNYFASEWCRREWRTWIDFEIAKHILSKGASAIYFVEVPGFLGNPPGMDEHEVARKVDELCGSPLDAQARGEAARVIHQIRGRRQVTSDFVQPFRNQGIKALRQEDLRRVLADLAENLDDRVKQVRRAGESRNTVPSYNKRFTGRLEELYQLRDKLDDDRAGVICGLHGLGGIGKSELAYTYAHAYADVYRGGRFYIPCEGKTRLRDAVLYLGNLFRDKISDEERKQTDTYFNAIVGCLQEDLRDLGHILLVLDNVTHLDVVSPQETDRLTALGPKLHLLATTREQPPSGSGWLTLGELPDDDALALLEKHRPFDDEAEREAGRRIVRQLGGFALAIELVAAGLAVHESATYAQVADDLGLDDLADLAEDRDVELRRHNHEKRLAAVLGPTLDDLDPPERRAMEYAALLPPDQTPLPWLRELMTADFPDLAEPGRWGDPWEKLCERLVRLGLFTRVEEPTTSRRLVRVHRLVQDLIRHKLPEPDLTARQVAINALIRRRDAALETTTKWQDARWEIAPLDALANLWADNAHPQAARLLNQVGLRWYALAEWSAAEPLMHRALAIDKQSYGADHPNVATALNNLAELLRDTNRLAEAEPLYRRALAIWEQSYGPDHPKVATALNNLALLLQATNRLAEAEPLFRRALAIDEQSHGPDHPNVAIRLNNLALLLEATNRLAEAEPLYRRALAICEQSYGPDHPKVATALNNLALLLKATNRLAEAEPLYRRALAIDEQSHGPDHPNVAIRLNNLAGLLEDTNRLAEAEPLYRRALAICEQSYGPDHPKVATALNNLALLLKATNRLAEAEPLFRRALAIDEQSHGPDHPNVAIRLNNLAGLLKATNRLAEAEPLYRRALAIDEQSYGPDHPEVATKLNNLAALLKATNRLAEAEPMMRRMVEIFLKFTLATGHQHPHLQPALGNYGRLLQQMGRSEAEVRRELNDLLAEYGMSLE